MGRVVVASADEATVGDFPQLAGVTALGKVETRAVIAGSDRPLLFWMHDLSPGAELRWEKPPVGHLAYVWSGEIEAGSERIPADGALIVEHAGSAELRAGPAGATIAHFHAREGGAEPPARAGGNAHIVGPNGIFQRNNRSFTAVQTQLANSSCPTCELWLHKSHMHVPRPDIGRHYHTEDEIIVVRDGRMLLGRRSLDAGTAVAIDADTIYTFGVPDEGLTFLNFRTCDPYFVTVGPKNEPLHAPIREQDVNDNPTLHLVKGSER